MEISEEPQTLKSLAESLAAGLTQEQEAILALRTTVESQIQALYSREREAIEDTTLQTSQDVHTLEQLRSKREEHLTLISSRLGHHKKLDSLAETIPLLESRLDDDELLGQLRTLFEAIPDEAEQTQEKCRQLTYSLQYALHLGHAIIEAVQGAGSPPPIQVYTTDGEKKIPSSRRMMVNKIG